MKNAGILRFGVRPQAISRGGGLVACLVCWLLTGCVAPVPMPDRSVVHDPSVPREQSRYSLSLYRVMPPDILQIDAVYNVRGANTTIRPGDQLTVRLINGLPFQWGEEGMQGGMMGYLLLYSKMPELTAKVINGPYLVLTDGTVNLGAAYGKIFVAGMTVAEATAAIQRHIHDKVGVANPKLAVYLTDIGGRQAITGQHLVRPDGTVGLGVYGQLRVAGMTLNQVRQALEVHLSQYLNQPIVSVDVVAYNSKVYYVIMDGGGYGQQIVRLPCTGNETVLDAISQVNGLSQVSSKRVWIARPSQDLQGRPKILKVNWQSVVSDGIATTNYQILPYDRVYVQADHLIATDNFLSKLIAPVNRVLGVVILGSSTAGTIQNLANGTGTTGGVP